MKKSLILLLTFIYAFTFCGAVSLAEEERVDVAALAPAASSSAFEQTSAEYANDGINENETYTKWVSADEDEMPWWSVDLGMEYKISAIEIDSGVGASEEERKDFRIIASNNEDFSDEIVLVNEVSADYGDTFQAEISIEERVRFVKVEKTVSGKLSIGEIRVLVNKDDILQGNETEKEEVETTLPAASKYSLYSDIAGLPCEDSVYLLSQIGILNGYTDGTFQPEKKMTRAEFTAVIIRMLNKKATVTDSIFSDVDASHWAYKEISTAAELGLVNGTGNGKFSPNDTVTASQVMKILVSAIGYSNLAEINGGFPYGYNGIASELKLYDGAGISGDEINRGQIAIVIKNALDAKTPEYNFDSVKVSESFDGESMLNKYLNLKKDRAVLDGVNGSSLKDVNARIEENYISINGVEYYTEIPDVSDYFGLTVTYYYTDDDKKAVQEVVAIIPDSRNVIKRIDSEDLEDYADGYLYYLEGDKLKREQISTKIYVIYNGSALRTYTKTDLLPANGYITLIDNNGDGVWDVYMVDDVKIGIVNIINAASGVIYLRKSTTPVTFDTTGDVIVVLDSETGEKLSLSSIKSGDVVSIRTSKNTQGIKKHNIVISKKAILGTLTGKNASERIISIDGVEYKCAASFDFNSITIGDQGEFYISDENFAAGFEGRSAKKGMYGYLKRAWIDEDTEDVMLRVFGQDGSWKTYTASDKIRVDGVKAPSGDYVLTNIVNSDTTYYQPIKYSVNALGVMTEIDTDYDGSDENSETRLSDPVSTTGYYYVATGIFGMKYGADINTVMMTIPSDKTAEEDYGVITAASLTYRDYTFEGYNPSKNNTFEFMIFNNSQISGMSSDLFIVDRVYEGMNSYDEPAVCLSGYHKGQKVEYFEETYGILNTSTIKKGDALTLALSERNEIKSYKKKFYRDAEIGAGQLPSDSISESTTEIGTNNGHYYAYGKVKANEEGMILVELGAGATYSPLLVNLAGGEYNAYYYDSNRKEVRIGGTADIMDEESVGAGAASMVLVHLYNAQIKDILIYD